MYCWGNVGFKRGAVYFAVLCFAVVLSLLTVSGAYGEDFKTLLKKADRGNAEAQYEVGRMYATWPVTSVQGIKRDYAKALQYLEKAAAKNYALALTYLGWMYYNGQGVKQDYSRARKYYERAAAQNNAYALCTLGIIYEYGYGVNRDLNKAVELYRKAAQNGSEQAKNDLARLKVPQSTSAANTKNNINPSKRASVPASNTPQKAAVPQQNNNTGTISANKSMSARPRVAVMNFEDKSEEGKAPVSAITDMMVTELYKAGIFTLVERTRLNAVAEELKLGQSGSIDPLTAPKIGKIAGAQYIMIGAVTLYYYSKKASGFAFPILGTSTKARTAYVVLDIRIIDTETGEIVYASASTGEGTQTTKKRSALIARNSSRITEGLLGMATRSAVEKHVSALTVKSQNW